MIAFWAPPAAAVLVGEGEGEGEGEGHAPLWQYLFPP